MGDSDGDGIDDELDDDCESDECGARAADVSESTEPIAVPPEDAVVVHLPYDAPEEMTQWPKRVFPRADTSGGHETELFLHYPEASEVSARRIHVTTRMIRDWLASRSETRDAHAVATW
jgi:hypothetical protein